MMGYRSFSMGYRFVSWTESTVTFMLRFPFMKLWLFCLLIYVVFVFFLLSCTSTIAKASSQDVPPAALYKSGRSIQLMNWVNISTEERVYPLGIDFPSSIREDLAKVRFIRINPEDRILSNGDDIVNFFKQQQEKNKKKTYRILASSSHSLPEYLHKKSLLALQSTESANASSAMPPIDRSPLLEAKNSDEEDEMKPPPEVSYLDLDTILSHLIPSRALDSEIKDLSSSEYKLKLPSYWGIDTDKYQSSQGNIHKLIVKDDILQYKSDNFSDIDVIKDNLQGIDPSVDVIVLGSLDIEIDGKSIAIDDEEEDNKKSEWIEGLMSSDLPIMPKDNIDDEGGNIIVRVYLFDRNKGKYFSSPIEKRYPLSWFPAFFGVPEEAFEDDAARKNIHGKLSIASQEITKEIVNQLINLNTGSLTIRTAKEDALVYLNGDYMGKTSFLEGTEKWPELRMDNIPVGIHDIEVVRYGFVDRSGSVYIKKGITRFLDVRLPEEDATGTLLVSTSPIGGDIWIDAEYIGRTCSGDDFSLYMDQNQSDTATKRTVSQSTMKKVIGESEAVKKTRGRDSPEAETEMPDPSGSPQELRREPCVSVSPLVGSSLIVEHRGETLFVRGLNRRQYRVQAKIHRHRTRRLSVDLGKESHENLNISLIEGEADPINPDKRGEGFNRWKMIAIYTAIAMTPGLAAGMFASSFDEDRSSEYGGEYRVSPDELKDLSSRNRIAYDYFRGAEKKNRASNTAVISGVLVLGGFISAFVLQWLELDAEDVELGMEFGPDDSIKASVAFRF